MPRKHVMGEMFDAMCTQNKRNFAFYLQHFERNVELNHVELQLNVYLYTAVFTFLFTAISLTPLSVICPHFTLYSV